MAMMISAYLETTRGFPSDLFSSACENLSKRPTPFPPSAGEVYAECERLAAEKFRNRLIEPKRLPRPEFSPEHRQAMLARLKKLHADLATGRFPPPHEMPHGYSAEHLANWNLVINRPGAQDYVMRTDADGVPLKIPAGEPGAGQTVQHGYLTRYEAQQPHERNPVVKTVPGSFLEKWEREKGFEHFGREAIIRQTRDNGASK
jgi:hypothetical protein